MTGKRNRNTQNQNKSHDRKPMKTFRDGSEQTWIVDVTVATLGRVRDLAGVELIDAALGNLAGDLSKDPILLVNVLYAVCKPEADSRNITDEQFGALFYGDSIDHATHALLEALVDFFPSGRAEPLRIALQRIKTAEKMALTAVEKVLDDPDWEAKVQAKIDEYLADAMRGD